VKTILIATALIASIASASAGGISVTTHGDVTIGRDKFDPPKGARSPTDEQLARSPGQYRGKAIISGGVVSQVVEDDDDPNRVVLMVRSISDYDELPLLVAYEHYDPDSRILEGDRVILWGEYAGMQSYETVLNAHRTIPRVNAEQVVVLPKNRR
jgi:hypothetical protein